MIEHEQQADPTERDSWPRQHSRIRELLDSFHCAFSRRLRKLDAGDCDLRDLEDAARPQ